MDCGALQVFIQQRGAIFLDFKLGRGKYWPEAKDPLSYKGTILEVTTRTPKDKELQKCPHVTCSLAHEWDPQNVSFPKRLCTLEEEISRNIGEVMTEGLSPWPHQHRQWQWFSGTNLWHRHHNKSDYWQCQSHFDTIKDFIWNKGDGTICDTG